MTRLPGNIAAVRAPPSPSPVAQAHKAITRSMAQQGMGSPLMPGGDFQTRRMQSLPARPLPPPPMEGGYEHMAYRLTPPPAMVPQYASPMAARALLRPPPPQYHRLVNISHQHHTQQPQH